MHKRSSACFHSTRNECTAACLMRCACMQAFWHSSAHVLGEALERLYGVDLTIGPVIDEGFYYDASMGEGRGTLAHDEWPKITAAMEGCVKEGQKFERVEISREEALEMFQENSFKVCAARHSCARTGCTLCVHCCPVLSCIFQDCAHITHAHAQRLCCTLPSPCFVPSSEACRAA